MFSYSLNPASLTPTTPHIPYLVKYIKATLKSLFLLMTLKRYVGHREYFTSDVFLIQEISTWGELPIFS